MGIKVYRPTSPGRRNSSVDTFEDITTNQPHKPLLVMLKKHGGRNMHGRITVRHRGGGADRYYRMVDFIGDKLDVAGTVQTIEYDPNRGARIALVQYPDKAHRYVIAPIGLKVGDTIKSSWGTLPPAIGNRMPLKFIPVGSLVFNIELQPGKGGIIARGAGTTVPLRALNGGYAEVVLPSGEVRLIDENCRATLGTASNPDRRLIRWGKAGRNRHRGKRPSVRGKAMNPVDHPHGGGEGNSPIGLTHPKTPWGKHALGVKTRKRGKWSDKFISQRRKKK